MLCTAAKPYPVVWPAASQAGDDVPPASCTQRTRHRLADVAEYRFLTTWLLDAPREAAWDVIEDTASWPEWWRGVVRVEERDPGGENHVGGRYLIEWRSRLPYPIEFEFTVDRVEHPKLMEGAPTASSTGSAAGGCGSRTG